MSKNIKTVTAENFEETVINQDKPVIVDFWAAWCGPCKMLAPFFDDCAASFEDKAVFGKVNVDEQQDLARRFKVMSIPTLILFKDGKAVKKSVGVITKDAMSDMIKSAL